MYQEVSFNSEGAELRGRHYCHPAGQKPTVVMTHGTTATITMAVDQYAEAIFAAGFDVLLYDHKNFGLSGGEPRQEINPWVQTRGYRDAVAFTLLILILLVRPTGILGESLEDEKL